MTSTGKNLFFIPFDQGADIPGASQGVYKVFDSFQDSQRFKQVDSYTFYERDSFMKQKGIINDEEFSDLQRSVWSLFSRDQRILFISGDHSITYYLYQIVAGFFGESIPLLIFDAHSDASREYDDWINHGCFVRELVKKVKPEIYHIGVRYDPLKLKGTDEMVFPSFSFLPDDSAVEELLRKKIGGRKCYLSVDVDVLEPQAYPGVYFPVAGGLTIKELSRILKSLYSLNVVAADLVEYAPKKDIENKTFNAVIEVINHWLEA